MNGSRNTPEISAAPINWAGRVRNPLAFLARRILFAMLSKVKRGVITVRDGSQRHVFGRLDESGLQVEVTVHDPRFYPAVAFGGSIGSGEAYMVGYWSCDDLTTLFRIVVRNRAMLDNIELGWARLRAPFVRLINRRRRNTRQGSRRNIGAHYDLGNEFYSLFLDETMAYSCNIFEDEQHSLAQAANAKYERICRKLALGPDDQVLEIGTGWGGFALYAASRYQCQVTTTTISEAQFALASQRVQAAGLTDRVTIQRRDYRDLQGKFDKLVSIEMIEAVGHRYLETFFHCCSERLRDNGMLLLQAITLPDQSYDLQLRTVDFIKHYIFPGSCIPSVAAIGNAVARATDLRLCHCEDIGPHYVSTLRLWRAGFRAQLPKVRKLGFSESFIRMWEYYLAYCEGGFAERYLGDVQMLLVKPDCRRQPILGPIDDLSGKNG